MPDAVETCWGIIFPVNLVVGIPYEAAAQMVIADEDAQLASAQQVNTDILEER